MKIFSTLIIFLFGYQTLYAQSFLSGDLMLNYNFFKRDSTINALGNPLYDNLLSGGEAWLSANYRHEDWKFRAGIRFDAFHNSNLRDPSVPYTNQGLGMWYVEKDIEKLTITGGYFYDQFGTGITLRAYEDRGIAIDNGMFGIRLKYQFNDNLMVKAFTARTKNRLELYEPIIKGANIENYFTVNDNINFQPGLSFVNRTIDANSMNAIVSNVNLLPLERRFIPKYNVYLGSYYHTLNFYNFTWISEFAYKSPEAMNDVNNELYQKAGSVFYNSLNYTKGKLGITLQHKRTENFNVRTSPNEVRNNGVLDFIPPMSRQNTYRLPARYQSATQLLSEQALQFDIFYSPKKGYNFNFNTSVITTLQAGKNIFSFPLEAYSKNNITADKLFYENYLDFSIKKKSWSLLSGLQYIFYNIEAYQFKPNAPDVHAISPFFDFNYKLTKKQSINAQLQYTHTKEDFGSWLYGGFEFNIAPHWSFSLTDMYNISPTYGREKKHYYALLSAYTIGSNRFTVSYARQVEGVVCTGGVCRFEPAFNGVRVGITSSF